MRKNIFIFLFLISFIGCATTCRRMDNNTINQNKNMENNDTTTANTLIITINAQTFDAILLDNNSTKAFMEMLPMTVTMNELNGNEKYFTLNKNLPTNSSNPGTINNGDIMLYGSNTLVIFYKEFATSYSYTKLGQVENPSGFASALGTGNTKVTFELK